MIPILALLFIVIFRMTIIFFINRDIYSLLALNLLLLHLKNHNIHVFYTQKVGPKRDLSDKLLILHNYETNWFIGKATPVGDQTPVRLRFFTFNEVKKMCVSYEQNDQPNSPEFIRRINALAPDIFISIRYGKIFREDILKIPSHGVINLHSGLLPAYRGVMPTFWAMLNNENTIGTTLHWIDSIKIDAGPIIAQSIQNLDSNHSYLWNVINLYPGGCNLILDVLQQIKNGVGVTSIPQKYDGNYYSFPSQDELDSFRKKGLCLSDLNEMDIILKQFFKL